MNIMKFGAVSYTIYSKAELEELGLTENHIIGRIFAFCVPCGAYRYFINMSHRGRFEQYEVCVTCNNHHRYAKNGPIKNSPDYIEYEKSFPLNDPRD